MSITNCSIERLDHLGIIAGVIKDLKMIELTYIERDQSQET